MSEKKSHRPFGKNTFFYPNGRWWHVPGDLWHGDPAWRHARWTPLMIYCWTDVCTTVVGFSRRMPWNGQASR